MKNLIFTIFILLIAYESNAKIIYIDPVNNAKFVNVENSIIIGFDERIVSYDKNKFIEVRGSISGIHSGELIISSDRKKLIFKPDLPFAYNETVEVKITGLKTSITSNNKLNYTFQTQVRKLDLSESLIRNEEADLLPENSFDNPYSYGNLPQLTVSVFHDPSPGNLYFNTYRVGNYAPNIIISNNLGIPIYSKETMGPAIDFKKQPNGLMTYYTSGMHYAENSDHIIVDSFFCGNGYSTDSHELQLLNNGHALLFGYDPQPVDMSQIVAGGDSNAIVVGLIIQEIDENKNVVFQWRSWDHFSILDAINIDFTANRIDYVHGNAIEPDTDGNILLSSRHLCEITKINKTTGDIIWRLGGANNEFNILNDTLQFQYQHSIRRIPNGNVILFDNGNNRAELFSRAVEYQLDEVNKIATLVWEYRNNPVIYGFARGSVQRMQNGNTLICWGYANPIFTEVTPAGNIALEMSLPENNYSYRVFRDQADLTLNLKVSIEGLYNAAADNLNRTDTVKAYIRNVNSPYNIVDSLKSIVDSVNFNGNFRFEHVSSGTYYIALKYRNGIETWSKNGGESITFGDVLAYNFTDSESKAFGNNLVLKGSRYCIYSGDINQDGTVDGGDLSMTENDVAVSNSGYIQTDLNGDDFADAADLSIVENNVLIGINSITP